MSIFSAIGSAFKSVGKVALGGVKAAVNVATNSIGIGPVLNVTGSNGGTQEAQPQSVTPPAAVAVTAVTNGGAPMAATPSLIDLGKYALGSLGDFLSGRSHVQVDANVGAGGRVADATGTSSSGLPSWLLPVGLGGAALFLLTRNSGGNNRKRY